MCRCVVERHRRGRENRTVAVLLDEDGAAAVSVPALDRYDEIDRLALPGAEPFQNANDIRIGQPAAAVLAESHFGQMRVVEGDEQDIGFDRSLTRPDPDLQLAARSDKTLVGTDSVSTVSTRGVTHQKKKK